MAKQRYKITVEPLTAVHIGTGEEITPLDYKIADKVVGLDFRKQVYWKFSSDKILRRLINEGKDFTAFERASVAGNMKELQKFFQANCVSINDVDYPCEVTSGFLDVYKANKDKDPLQNAAIVLQMFHEGVKPVIPGSSLKGSIRMALLNYFLSELSDVEYNKKQSEFETLLQEKFPKEDWKKAERYELKLQESLLEYSNPKNDPLRCIALSDCFVSGNAQIVGGLQNISAAQGGLINETGMQIQAECIKGKLLGGNAASTTEIIVDSDLQKQNSEITRLISIETIRSACNDFYPSEFKSEYEKFYKTAIDRTKIINKLKKELEDAVKQANKFILRVGRWSQVEFVTFEEIFRRPKTPPRNGRQQGSGNTRTVLVDDNNEYVPLGWCVISYEEAK